MESNTKTIQIPANCLGQITCRTNAQFTQTAMLTWKDALNRPQTCEFSGNGEKRELKTSYGQTMYLLAPSRIAYSIDCTFTYRDPSQPFNASAPKVREPTTSTEGPFTRIEIQTEDGDDNDNNDTWLTIELLSGVDPESPRPDQIDPSDLFLILGLQDESGLIATGIIVSPKYHGGDFQPGMEYWYLDAKRDCSSKTATSLQISSTSTDIKPSRSPSDAILTRPQVVSWYAVQTAGPDLADPNGKYGLSFSVEGTSQSNPQLHLFWYNTAERNLSLNVPSTLSPRGTSSASWYVAE